MTIKGKQFQRTEDGHLLLMSNEERNLLITDLTARLNYGVICLIERVDDFGPIHRNEKLTGFSSDDRNRFSFEVAGGLDISFAEKIMPYLRPIEKMTEVEKKDFADMFLDYRYCQIVDFFNEHMIDYHKTEDGKTMIEAGLAIEAPKGMYIFK